MICKSSLRRIPIVFIIKYYINPSMEYLVPIWWPSVSKIVQKHYGTRFSHCCSHCKTVSNSVCLSEGATITKGGRGLPIGQFNCFAVLTLAICSLSSQELWHLFFLSFSSNQTQAAGKSRRHRVSWRNLMKFRDWWARHRAISIAEIMALLYRTSTLSLMWVNLDQGYHH